jgi:adenylylsulfate kinase
MAGPVLGENGGSLLHRDWDREQNSMFFQSFLDILMASLLRNHRHARRRSVREAFAVWLTGLPASGKSAIAARLKTRLAESGLSVEVLESDAVRTLVTPSPTYSAEERGLFYRTLAFYGSRLVAHGVPVIFDATANRRAYRDLARALIRNFVEVAVVCPLDVCRQRDKKGTYGRGLAGRSTTVPGLQEPYEPPLKPELTVETTGTTPEAAADLVLEALRSGKYLQAARGD